MLDLRRYFWIRETGTGQQEAQLHERYMMIMMMKDVTFLYFATSDLLLAVRHMQTALTATIFLFYLMALK